MTVGKKSWDVANVASQIHSLSRECSSAYTDGITSFELKKDLYHLQEIINQSLKTAPDFGNLEKQWLKEQEQKRIIKLLKE